MIILKAIIVLAAVCAVALIINYFEKKNAQFISFRESLALADLPVVTFYQGSVKLNFLLDTGANLGAIDKGVSKSLIVENTNRISKMSGIGGSISDVPIVNLTFTYKDRVFEDGFQVVDLSNTFSAIKSATGVTIHGIIGTAFMQKYKYILDFKEMIAYSKK